MIHDADFALIVSEDPFDKARKFLSDWFVFDRKRLQVAALLVDADNPGNAAGYQAKFEIVMFKQQICPTP